MENVLLLLLACGQCLLIIILRDRAGAVINNEIMLLIV